MQRVENGTGSPSNVAPKTSVLDNWEKPRAGEQKAAFDKRTQYSADDIRSEAQMLVNGDKRLKDISGRDAGLLKHYASQAAKELDPTWNVADADSRYDALKKFTNPDSRVSQQLRAHVTAAGAIDNVEAAYNALQNGNLPLFNQIRNDFRSKTGSDLPINAKTGAMILAPEIIKSIIPGGGGVTERLEAQHLLNTSLSPAQTKAVFDELKNFQGNSLVAIQNDWTKSKLPKDQFRERMLGDSPAAQELLDYAEKKKNQSAEAHKAINNPPPVPTAYEDKAKEARYQEWLKKRNSEKK